MENNLRMAIYLRLSLEDNSDNIESNSIKNQRELIYEYIKSKEDLKNAKIIEKTDDGFTGTNFNRPAMMELINLVKAGTINCIILKIYSHFWELDLSL